MNKSHHKFSILNSKFTTFVFYFESKLNKHYFFTLENDCRLITRTFSKSWGPLVSLAHLDISNHKIWNFTHMCGTRTIICEQGGHISRWVAIKCGRVDRDFLMMFTRKKQKVPTCFFLLLLEKPVNTRLLFYLTIWNPFFFLIRVEDDLDLNWRAEKTSFGCHTYVGNMRGHRDVLSKKRTRWAGLLNSKSLTAWVHLDWYN